MDSKCLWLAARWRVYNRERLVSTSENLRAHSGQADTHRCQRIDKHRHST